MTARRLRALWRVARSVHARFEAQDGAALAGHVAYSTFLSIFPFAIFATALAGQLIGPERADEMVEALFGIAPEHVARTLAPVIRGVTTRSADGVLTLSALGALVVASNAMEAVRVALDRAYRVRRERGFLARRARGLLLVVLATATFGVLATLVIAAPLGLAMAERLAGVEAPFGVGVARYGIAALALAFFLFQLHMLLPSQRPPRRRLWPGIAVTMLLLGAGAWAFSLYLAHAPSYTLTYGAFAGVIVTLLFFYLVGAAIIIGAVVNAVLMSFRRPTPADDAPL